MGTTIGIIVGIPKGFEIKLRAKSFAVLQQHVRREEGITSEFPDFWPLGYQI
jgi:hypothetical protein